MTGAVILAAGLSRRMGAFKPLLPLGGGTLIESAARRLREGGAARIVVVTGSRARDVERALAGMDLRFAHNPAFRETQMLDSAKIGLRALGECDEVFLLPADIPLFCPSLLQMLRQARAQTGADAAHPRMEGRNGHPLLLGPRAARAVLEHDGRDGVKGALAPLAVEACPVGDPGCLLDADTKADYERLLAFRAESVPAAYEIEALHDRFGSTEAIRRHCRAVERRALALAASPACAHLNKRLLAAAARVHDAARTKPQHAARLAQALLDLGYVRAAECVSVHMELPPAMWGTVSEATVLYLADKLVMEDRAATLDERFARAARRCAGNEQALLAAASRQRAAERIWNLISEVQQ